MVIMAQGSGHRAQGMRFKGHGEVLHLSRVLEQTGPHDSDTSSHVWGFPTLVGCESISLGSGTTYLEMTPGPG